MDLYQEENDDFLILVAAGNSGESNNEIVFGSVGAPANAKNILSVGAGMRSADAMR